MKLKHFSIRDLLWLTLLCAVLAAWLLDARRRDDQLETYERSQHKIMRQGLLVLNDMNNAPPNPSLWTIEDALSDDHDPVAYKERLRVAKLRLEALQENVEERLKNAE